MSRRERDDELVVVPVSVSLMLVSFMFWALSSGRTS
jgi:nitrogen fixation-related uncharacterized protein